MNSLALEKITHITDSGDICYCECSFYKVCAVRIANNLPCKKSIIRITEIEDIPLEVDDGFDVVRSLDKRLSSITNSLSETLRHANRMK
jgi:hypothetical protein